MELQQGEIWLELNDPEGKLLPKKSNGISLKWKYEDVIEIQDVET